MAPLWCKFCRCRPVIVDSSTTWADFGVSGASPGGLYKRQDEGLEVRNRRRPRIWPDSASQRSQLDERRCYRRLIVAAMPSVVALGCDGRGLVGGRFGQNEAIFPKVSEELFATRRGRRSLGILARRSAHIPSSARTKPAAESWAAPRLICPTPLIDSWRATVAKRGPQGSSRVRAPARPAPRRPWPGRPRSRPCSPWRRGAAPATASWPQPPPLGRCLARRPSPVPGSGRALSLHGRRFSGRGGAGHSSQGGGSGGRPVGRTIGRGVGRLRSRGRAGGGGRGAAGGGEEWERPRSSTAGACPRPRRHTSAGW